MGQGAPRRGVPGSHSSAKVSLCRICSSVGTTAQGVGWYDIEVLPQVVSSYDWGQALPQDHASHLWTVAGKGTERDGLNIRLEERKDLWVFPRIDSQAYPYPLVMTEFVISPLDLFSYAMVSNETILFEMEISKPS